jgi:hypothetical protein
MVISPLSHKSVTAGQALAAARAFIADQLTDLMGTGNPWRMRSPFGSVWIVPVWITYPGHDRPNTVGSVAVDEATGTVVSWTPADDVLANAEAFHHRNAEAIAASFDRLADPNQGS